MKRTALNLALAAAMSAGGLGMVTTPAIAGEPIPECSPDCSVAREWNEAMLQAIRNDYARPTMHARNLFHVSVAMYDAWAAYDAVADQWLHQEKMQIDPEDLEEARDEAIAFAAYRVLQGRFAKSPGADETLPAFDTLMDEQGYDKTFTAIVGDHPAALGNRIAVSVLFFGLNDNANEQGGYENLYYEPVNPPLVPALPGNPDLVDPNRWQPLALDFFIDQSGNVILGGYPGFLSPEWGIVTPFALTEEDLTIHPDPKTGFDYWVYHDPGPPPHFNGKGDEYYRWGNEMVAVWGGHLDPADNVMIDISPASIGNAELPTPEEYPNVYEDYYDFFEGGDWGTGYTENPVTNQPYTQQLVPRGDYARILAEFWADGPDSETPPGHWFVLNNYVSDHPLTVKQLGGEGPLLDDLQWDVKTMLTMGGAMHDVAVSAWGCKGWYDYIRPVSAIRYMAAQGQSSDPDGPSYDPNGIGLHPGSIEVVTEESRKTYHADIPGPDQYVVGRIALKTWKGHNYIDDPETEVAGVGWILAENWWPYQRPSFVTPPFAGYVSGHSTYSRAAALVMELMTNDSYFPGGMGVFECPQNEFLVFEDGPSVHVTLQWARYMDASDQCSLSRIWGGIHPPADDIPGRQMGQQMGPDAYNHAQLYFKGRISCPPDLTADRAVDVQDVVQVIFNWGSTNQDADANLDGIVDLADLVEVVFAWGSCD